MTQFNRFHALLGAPAVAVACLAVGATTASAQTPVGQFRPPAVPLITSDPYLNVWSMSDHLNDSNTKHWTQKEHSLVSLIRVDGVAYRLMGNDPSDVPAIPQVGFEITPTRSIYQFQNEAVHVTMTFLSPSLPHDLEVMSRPLSYITWDVRSADGKNHSVSIYDSASSELAVNTPSEPVEWSREKAGGLVALKVGSVAQTVFSPAGDDTRINWGYVYLSASDKGTASAIGGNDGLLRGFVQNGTLPSSDDATGPRAVNSNMPVLALSFDLGKVGDKVVSRHAMVALDEIYNIKYFGEKLRPYWKRNDMSAADLLKTAEKDYSSLTRRCAEFDSELMADLTKTGGPEYARMCALAYRQCLTATGLAADRNKQPLLFPKENSSNGDIGTVDILFPMSPMLIALSPTLAKASVVPAIAYGSSPRWKFPNAPHDLGTYPVARGTDDGGEQMPVEESGNILLICDAIAKEDGNADFVSPWWSHLEQWAQYLEQYGLDPEDQLCTDDFMGHLAHNSNLSIKAILALAAYADLCKMRGETANATKYRALAEQFAAHWVTTADDGDHFRLAFDKPNTWGQKYNLVWDKILGLNIFPASVAAKEVAFYKKQMQPYGFPLDNRTKLTKTDWSFWCATLADNQADFVALTAPTYTYLNKTRARLPFVDAYTTDTLEEKGMMFRARSVVGGIFIKMLTDPVLWKKWSSGDPNKATAWAELPKPPVVTEVVATSKATPSVWKYTTAKPSDSWTAENFDDSSWMSGPGPFATDGTPGVKVGTNWNTDDIYIRRTLTLPAGDLSNLQLYVYHDEDIDVYINGVLAAHEGGYDSSYITLPISSVAKGLLKPGAKITVAAHCHQTTGGQGIDVGFATVTEAK